MDRCVLTTYVPEHICLIDEQRRLTRFIMSTIPVVSVCLPVEAERLSTSMDQNFHCPDGRWRDAMALTRPWKHSGGEWSSGVTSAGLDAGPPHDDQRLSQKAESLFD